MNSCQQFDACVGELDVYICQKVDEVLQWQWYIFHEYNFLSLI